MYTLSAPIMKICYGTGVLVLEIVIIFEKMARGN